ATLDHLVALGCLVETPSGVALPESEAQISAEDRAAIDAIRDEPERRERLAALSRKLCDGLRQRGWAISDRLHQTPIVPLIVGSERAALSLQQTLRDADIFAPAIRPPTVAPGQSRVRLSLRADLTDDDLGRLIEAVGRPAP
ncbi:MAG: aminotransferase class I/II-fold pyridoxal phosphate-dependent enzyme, partial [Phycisphaeraceae bacterium]